MFERKIRGSAPVAVEVLDFKKPSWKVSPARVPNVDEKRPSVLLIVELLETLISGIKAAMADDGRVGLFEGLSIMKDIIRILYEFRKEMF